MGFQMELMALLLEITGRVYLNGMGVAFIHNQDFRATTGDACTGSYRRWYALIAQRKKARPTHSSNVYHRTVYCREESFQ